MMKVLHVVLNLKMGGLERFVVELTKNYSSEVLPYVLCLEEEGELARYLEAKLFALQAKPGLKIGTIPRIVSCVKQNGIDLIHTHNESTHFCGSVSGVLAGVPVIHTRHGRYLHNSRKKLLLSTLSSFLTMKIVGVSEDVSNLVMKKERIAARKMVTVLNGVDVVAYSPRGGESSRADSGKRCVNIGMVARLDPVKDHLNLLRSCRILMEEGEEFMLFIVGDGPMRAELEAETQRLQLQERVVFTGTRHDIPEILKNLDIFALFSTSEGISMTLLESMSCSLPVVATDVGGNPEVVVDGETGYLVPAGDPEQAAEKLRKLIGDPGLRKTIGEAGRERVIRRFSIAQTAARYEELYREMLKGR